MKKLIELLKLDDQMKLIASATAAVMLLILAILLPLCFRAKTPEVMTASAGTEDKAQLFADYWYNEGASVQSEKLEAPAKKTEVFCDKQMQELVMRCIDDRALEYTEPTGREYTILTGENGEEVQLCRMWLEAKGDWRNWLDVCFDAESGDLYYFYLSRECLTNQSLYHKTLDEAPTAESVAQALAAGSESRLRYFSEDGAGNGTAVLASERGMLCYEISCAWYDALVDIKINCS